MRATVGDSGLCCCVSCYSWDVCRAISIPFVGPRSGELWTQKLKSRLSSTQSLKVLPLKPGVSQYIARHATPTAMDFSVLISTLLVHSPAFFPKPLSCFSCVAVGNTGSCVGSQNRIGHPAHRYR